ncbi:MAG: hypothetical protein ABR543_13545 [Gemmatimonadaceae bacterium]
MKRLAVFAVVLALAACKPAGDKSDSAMAADSAMAPPAMAPAPADTGMMGDTSKMPPP